MIALLTGLPQFVGNQLILVCGGVGYGVAVNEVAQQALRAHPKEVTLYIHTHVREDVLELFGFQSAEEKNLFETLLSVSGVGPKTALVVTGAPVTAIKKAVEEGNVSFFFSISTRWKKIGTKNYH
jgi:Holliday junction DNA helicase RuvA